MEFNPQVRRFAESLEAAHTDPIELTKALVGPKPLEVQRDDRLPVISGRGVAKGVLAATVTIGVMQPTAAAAATPVAVESASASYRPETQIIQAYQSEPPVQEVAEVVSPSGINTDIPANTRTPDNVSEVYEAAPVRSNLRKDQDREVVELPTLQLMAAEDPQSQGRQNAGPEAGKKKDTAPEQETVTTPEQQGENNHPGRSDATTDSGQQTERAPENTANDADSKHNQDERKEERQVEPVYELPEDNSAARSDADDSEGRQERGQEQESRENISTEGDTSPERQNDQPERREDTQERSNDKPKDEDDKPFWRDIGDNVGKTIDRINPVTEDRSQPPADERRQNQEGNVRQTPSGTADPGNSENPGDTSVDTPDNTSGDNRENTSERQNDQPERREDTQERSNDKPKDEDDNPFWRDIGDNVGKTVDRFNPIKDKDRQEGQDGSSDNREQETPTDVADSGDQGNQGSTPVEEEPAPDGENPAERQPSRPSIKDVVTQPLPSIVADATVTVQELFDITSPPPPPAASVAHSGPTPSSGEQTFTGYTELKEQFKDKYGPESGRIPRGDLTLIDHDKFGHHAAAEPAAIAFRELNEAYKAEFGKDIALTDSYRDYETQVVTKARKKNKAAKPGTSNHGWGMAFDMGDGIETEGTPEHEWMEQNAERFGIHHPKWAWNARECREQGLPSGKGTGCASNPEDWHWEWSDKGRVEFVPTPGVEAAQVVEVVEDVIAAITPPTIAAAVKEPALPIVGEVLDESQLAAVFPTIRLASTIMQAEVQIASAAYSPVSQEEDLFSVLPVINMSSTTTITPGETPVPPAPEASTGRLAHYSTESTATMPSGVTAQELDKVFEGTGFAGLGQAFIDVEREYGINALFWASHAFQEVGASGHSRIADDKNNIFGYGAFDSDPYNNAHTFATKAEGVKFVAEKFKQNYVNPDGKYHTGSTVGTIFKRYATDQQKGQKVVDWMNQLTDKINQHRPAAQTV